jgi:hypothetical protein
MVDKATKIVGPTTISAQNTFTQPIWVPAGAGISFTITGTAGSTVTAQRCPTAAEPADASFVDVNDFTSYKTYADIEPTGAWWRVGVKTSNFSTNAVITVYSGNN